MRITEPQRIVIQSLAKNDGSYLRKSRFYHWSKVYSKDGDTLIFSIHRPTVYSLINKKVIIQIEPDKYTLNKSDRQVLNLIKELK